MEAAICPFCAGSMPAVADAVQDKGDSFGMDIAVTHGLALATQAASAKECHREMPLPAGVRLTAPGPEVPEAVVRSEAKMQEYLDSGARLSWLIDPANRMVYVYRPNQPVERLENPATILGDPVLPGFIIALERL